MATKYKMYYYICEGIGRYLLTCKIANFNFTFKSESPNKIYLD